MAVKITETAAREINTIIKDQDLDPENTCLRVGVKGGGCSGFSYILDLTETRQDSDELWEFHYELSEDGKTARAVEAAAQEPSDGGVATANATGAFSIKVVCDPKSYLYLDGTTIDFKDEVMGRGFVFNNPKASTTCGCGSSFAA